MSTEDKNWKTLEGYTDNDLSRLINLSEISKIESQSPLLKIKRTLLMTIFGGIVFCGLYLFIIFYLEYWQVRLAMTIVLAFSIWAVYSSLHQYRNIKTDILANSSVLDELKRQQKSITEWIRLQIRVALFVYPISAGGGFMLGGALGSGRTIVDFLSRPYVGIIFIVLVIVITPICHLIAKRVYKVSFGNHLAIMQQNIEELETEK